MTLSKTGNLLGKTLFAAGKEKANGGAMGGVSDCSLALLEDMRLLCCFFSLRCVKHSLEKAGFTQLAKGSPLLKLPNYKLRHINSSQSPCGGIIDH